MAHQEPSPFDTLDSTFRLLGVGPSPMALNCAVIGCGLPARDVPLVELRDVLLHPATSHTARDAVLGYLVVRAQREGGKWSVALLGMLLPGLKRAVEPLACGWPERRADLEGEMLAGVLQAIPRTQGGRLASRLVWSGGRQARRLLTSDLAVRPHPTDRAVSQKPPRPWEHPDLLLAEAVGTGVLSADEATLIGETRVGEVDLHALAQQLSVPYNTLQKRRRRAEKRLVEWLLDEPVTSRRP